MKKKAERCDLQSRRIRNILRIMKISVFLFLVTVTSVFANGSYSQNKKMTLNMTNVKLGSVLDAIEEKSEFYFLINKDLIDENSIVSINVTKTKISNILDLLLNKNKIEYVIQDKQIVFIKRELQKMKGVTNQGVTTSDLSVNLETSLVNIKTVQNKIRGKVTDANGVALPGVNVIVKGTSIGAQTDFDGDYSLNVPSDSTILVFSYLGFKTQEVEIANKTLVNISLIEDIAKLEEIVVVGYGGVKRSDLTGSVSSVTQKDIQEIPTNTISNLLQGRAAGVQVTTGDGAPGGGINIRIRGNSTITGSTEPLYIIDGFPVNSDNDDLYVGGGFNEGGDDNKVRANALSFINPADIESIEILKDAAATAIYGSRGSNGVVLITTKGGAIGKTKVSVNYSTGAQTVIKKITTLDGPAWVAGLTEAEINNNIAPADVRYNGSDEFHPLAQNAETHNWQDILYRTALIQDVSVTFSGGTDKTKYFLSGKYYDAEGIMVGSNYEDMQARFNLDQEVGFLNLKSNFLVSHNINNRVPAGAGFNYNVVREALSFSPAINPDWFNDAAGLWYTDPKTSGPNVYTNPLRIIEGIHDEIATNRLLGNVQMDLKLHKTLKLTGSYGIDYSNATRDTYIDRTLTFSGTPNNNGTARINNVISTRTNANTYLTYNQSFGEHNLNGIVGVERVKQVNEFLNVSISDFLADDLRTDNIGGGNSELLGASNGKRQWQTEGYFGRLNYDYQGKYYISLNARYDGSSVFGKNNKWAFFPSLALAWKPTKENFLQNQNVISDFKIRGSIGQTGNGNIDAYSSLGVWSIGPNRYSYGNGELVNGASLSRIQNDNLKWETTTQYNIGFDARFLNGKLGLTFDYYLKDTDDLILDVVIPKSSGFKSSRQNLGALRNSGVELAADYAVFRSKNFSWDVNANATFMSSEATDVGEGTTIDPNTNEPYIEVSEWQRRGGLRLYEGKPAGQIYGFVTEGVFDNQEQADNWPVDMDSNRNNNKAGYWIYKDINGDGIITDDDQQSLGTGQPKMIFGFTHRLKYKALDLSLFFQGTTGGKVVMFYPGDSDDPFYSDFWTPENQDAQVARRGDNGFRHNRFHSRDVQNGNYLRLKNVRLGYTVPTKSISFLSGLNLYMNISNLFTITGYKGYDPDVSSGGTVPFSQGFDTGVYPKAKTFTFGLNANF
ncbi:TonB-dependent receptor [Flavivirga eckloniae]|uniref:SusC/RagA family TonB-linked outer membrane protein n=1 Tax=Flavivirga eckloniae TaxID=1803846 RepID=A0A2K9PK44_9FLAO|nr:TonB-dependent receptor [Flavivirga eckloniae]AUP77420.1 hypothetical protein C1H87_01265 [Flavivirga eckloniae]